MPPPLDRVLVKNTGEVELRGADIAGIAVHIAARISALADKGEILTSRTVKDLTARTHVRRPRRPLAQRSARRVAGLRM